MTDAPSADTFDMVCGDPAAYFETPQAIADSAELTRAEKLQLLGEWATDLANRSNAADEGMTPEKTSISNRDMAIQAQILDVRAKVESKPDAPLAAMVLRVWNRLVTRAA